MTFLTSSRRTATAALIALPLAVGLALSGATAAQAAVSYTMVTSTDDAGFPVVTYTFAPSAPEAAETVVTYNGAFDTGTLQFNVPYDFSCADGEWVFEKTAIVTRIDLLGETEGGEFGVTESIILDPADCVAVVVPDPEPETTAPAVVVPPSETTAPVATEAAPRALASTGLELPLLSGGIAAAVLALGAVSVWATRRARSERP